MLTIQLSHKKTMFFYILMKSHIQLERVTLVVVIYTTHLSLVIATTSQTSKQQREESRQDLS